MTIKNRSNKASPTSSVEVSAEAQKELREKIAKGEKNRALKRREEREEERERTELAKERAALEGGDITNYIAIILGSLLFISLPLAERTIDWVQVGMAIGLNVLYAVGFHRPTWMHYLVFFMLNLLLVQWGPFVYNVPTLVQAVPIIYWVVAVLSNAAAIIIPYAVFVRAAKTDADRDYYWDLIGATVILMNFAALVATGVIPMNMLVKALKSMFNLVTHYSINPGEGG